MLLNWLFTIAQVSNINACSNEIVWRSAIIMRLENVQRVRKKVGLYFRKFFNDMHLQLKKVNTFYNLKCLTSKFNNYFINLAFVL